MLVAVYIMEEGKVKYTVASKAMLLKKRDINLLPLSVYNGIFEHMPMEERDCGVYYCT